MRKTASEKGGGSEKGTEYGDRDSMWDFWRQGDNNKQADFRSHIGVSPVNEGDDEREEL